MKYLRLILWIISIPIFLNCLWVLIYPMEVQATFGLTEDQLYSKYLFVSGFLMTIPLSLSLTGKYGVLTPEQEPLSAEEMYYSDLREILYTTFDEYFPNQDHEFYRSDPKVWENLQAYKIKHPELFRNHPA